MFSRLMVLVCLLIGVVARAAAQEWKPEMPEESVAQRPAASVSVDCSAGQSVQAAIDGSAGPVEIVINGFCTENVLIRDKDVWLRGANGPEIDGIRSVIRATPALIVRGPVDSTISGLSFSKSAGTAVSVRGANVTMSNCMFESNGTSGLQINMGGFVNADTLMFTGNIGRAINASDGQIFCAACDLNANGFAVVATRGAIVSLLDSVVTGNRGYIASDGGTIADLDCVTLNTPHACSMDVTGAAFQAAGGAVGAIVGADFKGQLQSFDEATLYVVGSRQTSTFVPGTGFGPANLVDFYGRIAVLAFPDVDPPVQSRVRGITGTHFGKILITDATTVEGSVQVTTSAQAQIDPTVIIRPTR